MKVTNLSAQIRNPDRINISIDGRYRFSLDVSQVMDFGVRVGRELTEEELSALEVESQFSKLYARTLEYSLMRPRSEREVRDYLYKKTLTTKYKSKKTGEMKERAGYSVILTDRVLQRLVERAYVDDRQFARWWVENRNQRKGSSLRKLRIELQAKGVDRTIIDAVLDESDRSDDDEIMKIIAKKRNRYPDEQKLIAYLARQGFMYDDIKRALADDPNE